MDHRTFFKNDLSSDGTDDARDHNRNGARPVGSECGRIIYFLATGSLAVIFWASAIGTASLTALFFGQRVAKDYPGAAVLGPILFSC